MSRLAVADAQKILDQHNCVRAKYGVPPLQWSWQLADDAQVHADRCGFWHSNTVKPSLLPADQGENIHIDTGGAVDSSGWMAEEADFNCAQNKCKSGDCGHWTQMIWQGTNSVGCAITDCPSANNAANTPVDATWTNSHLLVCRYNPPGNFTGRAPVSTNSCAKGAGSAGKCMNPTSSPQKVGPQPRKNLLPAPTAASLAASRADLAKSMGVPDGTVAGAPPASTGNGSATTSATSSATSSASSTFSSSSTSTSTSGTSASGTNSGTGTGTGTGSGSGTAVSTVQTATNTGSSNTIAYVLAGIGALILVCFLALVSYMVATGKTVGDIKDDIFGKSSEEGGERTDVTETQGLMNQ
jgi:hypothetical protein